MCTRAPGSGVLIWIRLCRNPDMIGRLYLKFPPPQQASHHSSCFACKYCPGTAPAIRRPFNINTMLHLSCECMRCEYIKTSIFDTTLQWPVAHEKLRKGVDTHTHTHAEQTYVLSQTNQKARAKPQILQHDSVMLSCLP